jgi:hypothetical protein
MHLRLNLAGAMETAAPAAPATDRPRRKRGYFLPGFIALAALVVIGGLLGAGDLEHPAASTLAGPQVAAQIALGIQAQQNASRPPSVTCPDHEPVRQGLRFNCTLEGHTPRPVHVTEVDARGRVQWSLTP